MKAAVISFPGSNCDFDMLYALQGFGVDAEIISAKQNSLTGFDAIFCQVVSLMVIISELVLSHVFHQL